MDNKIEQFIKRIGVNYKNPKNYEGPFLHSSYIHETPWDDVSYDRLEFFGDSILSFFVTEYLYNNYPDYNEGDMTLLKIFLVDKVALSKVGRELKIEECMFLGQGQSRDQLSDSIYEDVIESLIAAIYLDAGYEEAKKFVNDYIIVKADGVELIDLKDPKTRLQELLQSETRRSVKYQTDNGVRNEENLLVFTAKAMFDSNTIGEGSGFNKKEAEKAAAKDAIDRMA